MSFPVHDWQFWVVTAAVVVVIFFAARPVVRGLFRKTKPRRVDLTINRERRR